MKKYQIYKSPQPKLVKAKSHVLKHRVNRQQCTSSKVSDNLNVDISIEYKFIKLSQHITNNI